MEATLKVNGITVVGPVSEAFKQILTPDALKFVGELAREFEPRRRELLERRTEVQKAIDSGTVSRFSDRNPTYP